MDQLRQAAQQALDYWETCGFGDAVMVDKMDDLRAALAEPTHMTPAELAERVKRGEKWQVDAQPVAFSQFLTDVVTAAGLLSHGKTDKALAARISEFAFNLRTAPQPAKPAEQEAVFPEQKPMPDDMVKVLHDNLWDLYAGDTAPQPAKRGPVKDVVLGGGGCGGQFHDAAHGITKE